MERNNAMEMFDRWQIRDGGPPFSWIFAICLLFDSAPKNVQYNKMALTYIGTCWIFIVLIYIVLKKVDCYILHSHMFCQYFGLFNLYLDLFFSALSNNSICLPRETRRERILENKKKARNVAKQQEELYRKVGGTYSFRNVAKQQEELYRKVGGAYSFRNVGHQQEDCTGR